MNSLTYDIIDLLPPSLPNDRSPEELGSIVTYKRAAFLRLGYFSPLIIAAFVVLSVFWYADGEEIKWRWFALGASIHLLASIVLLMTQFVLAWRSEPSGVVAVLIATNELVLSLGVAAVFAWLMVTTSKSFNGAAPLYTMGVILFAAEFSMILNPYLCDVLIIFILCGLLIILIPAVCITSLIVQPILSLKRSRDIARLEKVLYVAGMQDQGATSCCAICLSEYDPGQELYRLPCGHLFHETCVPQWLSGHGTCPTCREPISSCHPRHTGAVPLVRHVAEVGRSDENDRAAAPAGVSLSAVY